MADPNRVWNCDESSFKACPTPRSVYGGKNTRVYNVTANNEKECYSAMLTVSASGNVAPTLILYPYERRVPPEIVQKFPRTWAIGHSTNGYQTAKTFKDYIQNCFYPYLIENNIQLPVALFVDGHKSHLTLELGQLCKELGIILVVFPPNCTQFIQPLDVSVFHPLKNAHEDEVTRWRIENKGAILPKSMFAPLLEVAINSIDKTTIINGFRACGIFPFTSTALKFNEIILSLNQENETGQDENNNSTEGMSAEQEEKIKDLEECLSPGQLEQFKLNRNSLFWTGKIEDEGLFHYWRRKMDIIENKTTILLARGEEIELPIDIMNIRNADEGRIFLD
jgi:hypothetical protein